MSTSTTSQAATNLPLGVEARCTRCNADLVRDNGEYLTWENGEPECPGTNLDHTIDPSAAQPVVTYLLSWSGGYDLPSFESFLTAEQAKTKAREHLTDADDGDSILILKVTATGLDRTVELDEVVL